MPDDIERLVRLRRYKRRLKAAAAVMLSLAAGTFLACQRDPAKNSARPNPAPNPTTPEISNLPAASGGSGLGGNESGGSGTGGSSSGGQGSGGTAAGGKHNQVDRREHRKGMPVRDNLVE